MLVLNRKRDESIIIAHPDGTRSTVTVVDIRGDMVRLGVTAPTEVTINRHEVQEAIDAGVPHRKGGAT